MARQNFDPTEHFTAAELEPATDAKEADGSFDRQAQDNNAAGFSDASDFPDATGESDAIAVAGDSLATAIERDILGLDPGLDWGPEPTIIAAAESDATAIQEIMSGETSEAEQEDAIAELLENRGKGVADAAHHLTSILTEDPDDHGAQQNSDPQAREATESLAAEVDKVSHISRETATIIVNGMRSNAGATAISGTAEGLLQFR